jgi:hypothetical protein
MNYLPASQTPDKKLAQTVADAPLPWLSDCRAISRPVAHAARTGGTGDPAHGAQRPRVAADQLEKIAPR